MIIFGTGEERRKQEGTQKNAVLVSIVSSLLFVCFPRFNCLFCCVVVDIKSLWLLPASWPFFCLLSFSSRPKD